MAPVISIMNRKLNFIYIYIYIYIFNFSVCQCFHYGTTITNGGFNGVRNIFGIGISLALM